MNCESQVLQQIDVLHCMDMKNKQPKLLRCIKRNYKPSGKYVIQKGSLLYRKLQRLSSASEKQIAVLLNLFEGHHIVEEIHKNTITLQHLDDKKCRK